LGGRQTMSVEIRDGGFWAEVMRAAYRRGFLNGALAASVAMFVLVVTWFVLS